MNLSQKKKMAAEIMKIGQSRVWMDPEASDELAGAMTRGDIRKFIGLGFITAKPKKGNSRGRFRKRLVQKKKGRKVGHGRRAGKKTARTPKKELWMVKIRAQRALLKKLREQEKIDQPLYRRAYRLSKAGTFRNKAQLTTFLIEKSKQQIEETQ